MDKVKESDIQRMVTDTLSVMRIWHIRLNTGAMFGSHKGKRWAVRFGRKGMADILAHVPTRNHGKRMCWIEVKKPGAKQTEEQREFEMEVIDDAQFYIVVSQYESLVAALAKISTV